MRQSNHSTKTLLVFSVCGLLLGCAESSDIDALKQRYTHRRWGGLHEIYRQGQVEASGRIGKYACRDDNAASIMVDRSVWQGISNQEALSLTDKVYQECDFDGEAKVALNTLGSFIDAVSVRYAGEGSLKAIENNVQKLIETRKEELSDPAGDVEAGRARRANSLRARIKRYEARGWSTETIDVILSKRVSKGMTHEQVLESWGPPCKVIETSTPNGLLEEWIYGGSGWRCGGTPSLDFRNGIVIGFKE